jgi:excisionase family DNA binding protein
MGDVLTAHQVAELLQVHVKTIHRLARRGVIPGSKLGRGWRFSKDNLYRIINPNEQNGNKPIRSVLEERVYDS